jgi:hypothetical protein
VICVIRQSFTSPDFCVIVQQKSPCNMKFEFNLSLTEIIVSYLLMMGVIFVGLFSGMNWLCFLALPLFLRGLTGWCPMKSLLRKSVA